MTNNLIIIDSYPLQSELFSENSHLFQCIETMAVQFKFELGIKWTYGKMNWEKYEENESNSLEDSDKLIIEIELMSEDDNAVISITECICSYLCMNKYHYQIRYNEYIRLPYGNVFSFKELDCCKPYLEPEQLFGIIDYLRKSKASLYIRISIKFQQFSYQMSCHSGAAIEPWGIINGFELYPKIYRNEKQLQWTVIQRKEILIKLLSLPTLHNGIKDMILGYDSRTNICEEKDFEKCYDTSIVVGSINNRTTEEYLCMQPKDFSYMTSIWGVPGQGKSVLSLSLIIQLWEKHRIPSLIIEPSKHEYRALANFFSQDVRVIGDMKHFNILEPPHDISYDSWSEVIITLLNMACQMPEDSVLSGYYRNAYLTAYRPVTPLTLLSRYNDIMNNEGFTERSSDFVKAGKARLEAFLIYFNGPKNNWYCKQADYFKSYKDFEITTLLESPVIIELASITTPKMKSAWVYFILQHLYSHIQKRLSQSDHLQNLLVLEEAHNILRKESNVEVLSNVANILAEARALGLGVVISDQSPKALDPSCTSMAQNVFSFKVVDSEDREIIARSTAGDMDKLLDIPKRNCMVRTNFMHETDIVKVTSKYAKGIGTKVKEENINYI